MKRIAVVTGASSGLGREYVKLIDERSRTHPEDRVAEIWVIARRRERLEALAVEVETPLRILPIDLADSAFEERIRTLYETEKPDVRMLVNAAGFGKIGSYADISEKDAAGMVDLNCRAPVLLCQLTLPYMREGARILNVCSTAGFSAFQYLSIYCATKSFLYRYSRALRVELFSRRISVTAVCPYWVKDTEFIPVAKNTGVSPFASEDQRALEERNSRAAVSAGSYAPKEAGKPAPTAGTGSQKPEKPYIRHFVLASKRKTVASWSMADTWHRFAVSTPGPVCTLHRIFAKIIPNELMAGIWALVRRM